MSTNDRFCTLMKADIVKQTVKHFALHIRKKKGYFI